MSSASPSIFFSLPPELRNMVYDLVIDQQYELGRVCSFDTRRSERETLPKVPSLVQVCRQIREETYHIWLSGNCFYLQCWFGDEVRKFKAWLDILGPRASAIEDLDVVFYVRQSTLPETIKIHGKAMDEFFVIRFCAYADKDTKAPLSFLGVESVPRIRYNKTRHVKVKKFRVELTVNNQQEARRAIPQLLVPLNVDDFTLKRVFWIFNQFTKAAVSFENGEKVLIDLWQYYQYWEEMKLSNA